MIFDLVVNNGQVLDGTGRDRFHANLGITAGKIAALAPDKQLTGRTTLDATGQVIAPGFIALHSHFDWYFPLADHDRSLAPLVLQGITTVVTGNCGNSSICVLRSIAPTLVMRGSSFLAQSALPFSASGTIERNL